MTPEELKERLDAQKWWDHYLNVLNERDRLREALRKAIEVCEADIWTVACDCDDETVCLAHRVLAALRPVTHSRPERDV